MLLQLSICTFISTPSFVEALKPSLDRDRYTITHCTTETEFLEYVKAHKHSLDCTILEAVDELPALVQQLHEAEIVLPAVIVCQTDDGDRSRLDRPSQAEALYHQAEVWFSPDRCDRLVETIDRAIDRFLSLSEPPSVIETSHSNAKSANGAEHFLMEKQQRLADKLRERLGYLGVYYKRNPQRFLRNLSPEDQQDLLYEIQTLYRNIVLSYFSEDPTLNQAIDEFVNMAFFADISVTHIVEIHMELMDEFSKQLQLEGRSEEILLDYRLTLIDTIAHLCEMYRRSIPRDS